MQSGDTHLWSGFEISHKLNRRMNVELAQQTRIGDNIKSINTIFIEGSFRYSPVKYIDIKPQIRFNLNNNNRNQFRYAIDFKFKKAFKKSNIEIYSRVKLQFLSTIYTGELQTFFRVSTGFEWKLNKQLRLGAEYELFYRLNDKNEVRNHRITGIVEIRLNNKADLNLFYTLDNKVNVKNPGHRNIIGCVFKFQI
ncbi:MAG: DUF2490 domain-containing protein [Bacteroidota bacterium]